MQNTRRPSATRAYRETCLDALNHLFGRNCYGRSFVTGLGFRPPMHPHDRRDSGEYCESSLARLSGRWPASQGNRLA